MEIKTYQKIIIALIVAFVAYKIYQGIKKEEEKKDEKKDEYTGDRHPSDPIPEGTDEEFDWSKKRREKSELVNQSFEF